MPQDVTETRTTGPVVTESDGAGRMTIQLITPGWGSSGYYSRDVIEAAGRDRVFPKGTHMYLDHPSESERFDRPERSVKDLAAVLLEDATWDGSGLSGPVSTFGPYKSALEEMAKAEAIGVSIRASAETEAGEAEGRKGTIVTRLVEGASVDFVTRAGRGGKVLAVLESAGANVSEAVQSDRYADLDQAVTAAYSQTETSYAVVRDFDDAARTVWFMVRTPNGRTTYEQSYDVGADDATVTLTGEPAPVVARTTYVPVDPAGQSTPTTESQGGTMPQIEEARLRQLEADAGRVQALESEHATATAENAQLKTQLAESKARDTARPAVTKVFAESESLPPSMRARLVESAVKAVTADMDAAAVQKAAEAARTQAETELAEALTEAGHGTVRGFGGGSAGGPAVSESDIQAAVDRTFGRTVKGA